MALIITSASSRRSKIITTMSNMIAQLNGRDGRLLGDTGNGCISNGGANLSDCAVME